MTQKIVITGYNSEEPVTEDELLDALDPVGLSNIHIVITDDDE